MNKLLFVFLILALTACKDSSEQVYKYSVLNIFNDNTSKVWLIDSHLEEHKELSPKNINFKIALIFHEDGSYQEAPVNQLGNGNVYNGKYEYDGDSEVLNFIEGKKVNPFKVVSISKYEIILWQRSTDTKLTLIPLPRL